MIRMSRISDALTECGALQFGDFTLASGAKSTYYIDIKKASTNPAVLKLIAELMAENVSKLDRKPDRIAGVVLGSIPLATAVSMETGIPFIMVRKEKKDHGTGKLIEGDLEEGDSVLVVEDVITTAGSAISAIKLIREAGGTVTDLFSVIDRQSGGDENLISANVKLTPLITADKLLEGRE